MNLHEEPVSVSTNEIQLTLAMLPFVPSETVSKVNNLFFQGEGEDGGIKVFHRNTLAINVEPEVGFKLETTDGDIIQWHVDDGSELTVTLKDGASWKKHIACYKSAATNVFSTPDVLEGMENFEEVTGRQLQPLSLSRPCDGGWE